jgi:phage baseplate assembly protein W
MSTDRASKFTIESKKIVTYSDFTDNFDINPQTGNLARITNEESVKQAIRNIVLTNRTERPYSTLGSKIQAGLFEPIDVVSTEMLKTTIKESIASFEPRATNVSVDVEPYEDYNAYFVTVIFSLINIPGDNFSIGLVLNRVR